VCAEPVVVAVDLEDPAAVRLNRIPLGVGPLNAVDEWKGGRKRGFWSAPRGSRAPRIGASRGRHAAEPVARTADCGVASLGRAAIRAGVASLRRAAVSRAARGHAARTATRPGGAPRAGTAA